MKEETIFDFNMSALRVWSLISDLRGFARWHPIYRIAGEAERGAALDVTWLLFGGDRKMTTQMIITRLTKPQLIGRSEEHPSELQSLMRNSYAVFCLKKKKQKTHTITYTKT